MSNIIGTVSGYVAPLTGATVDAINLVEGNNKSFIEYAFPVFFSGLLPETFTSSDVAKILINKVEQELIPKPSDWRVMGALIRMAIRKEVITATGGYGIHGQAITGHTCNHAEPIYRLTGVKYEMPIDLNHGSGSITGESTVDYTVSEQVNLHVTAALYARRQQALTETPRDYVGMSELGERCLRHLYLKHMGIPEDTPLTGERLRAMEMGHFFEEMVYIWMQAAGFNILRRDKNTGKQFEFQTANGLIKGHIDGAITAGPPIPNLVYPALWENKALKAKYWNGIVKHGLQKANPEYWGQTIQYMGYSGLTNTLFSTINKDTAEIYHCVIPHQPAALQKFADRGVSLIKALQMQLIPARISANADFYICKQCDRRNACWGTAT